MRIEIEPLCDELQIAADCCEEFGDTICSHLLRTIAVSIFEMNETDSECINAGLSNQVRRDESKSFIELTLVHASWNSFCDFERQAILKFLRQSRDFNFLKKSGFEVAALVMAKLRAPLVACFDSCLYYLLNSRVISLPQAIDALALANDLKVPISRAVERLGYASQTQIGQAQQFHQKLQYIDVSRMDIPRSLARLCPEVVCWENGIVPICEHNGALVFATTSPLELDIGEKLRFILNRDVRFVIGTEQAIQNATLLLYANIEPAPRRLVEFSATRSQVEVVQQNVDEDAADVPPPRQPIEPMTNSQMAKFRRLWKPVLENTS